MHKFAIFCIFVLINEFAVAQNALSSPEDMLDICIDSKYHKTIPGPESVLYGQCTPWKSHSCCTENTTVGIHEKGLYNFNYNHCNTTMSSKCLNHFTQDHCFYECSPNVGPWIVKENRSWRKQRFYGVPLCAAECENWFEDCKDDLTCTDNWSKNFDWRDGTCSGVKCRTNFCPQNAKCLTFGQVFTNARTLCEKVFDGSWKYTEDEPCMKMWFSGPNPNKKVAEIKAQSLFSAGSKCDFNVIVALALMFASLVNIVSSA